VNLKIPTKHFNRKILTKFVTMIEDSPV